MILRVFRRHPILAVLIFAALAVGAGAVVWDRVASAPVIDLTVY